MDNKPTIIEQFTDNWWAIIDDLDRTIIQCGDWVSNNYWLILTVWAVFLAGYALGVHSPWLN